MGGTRQYGRIFIGLRLFKMICPADTILPMSPRVAEKIMNTAFFSGDYRKRPIFQFAGGA